MEEAPMTKLTKSKRINRISIFWILGIFLNGCSPTPHQPIDNPNNTQDQMPHNDEMQVYIDVIQAEGTLEAARAQMTATAQIQDATATAYSQQINVTQTQQTWLVEVTQTQQAFEQQTTATERAYLGAQSTASAYGTATAISQQATIQTGQAQSTTEAQRTATQEVYVSNVTGTAQAVEDEITSLKLERERMTNRISAITPWVFGIAIGAILILAFTYWVKVEVDRRKAFQDSSGQVTQVLDVRTKGTNFITTDRMTSEAVFVDTSGEITTSILDPTTRAQIIMVGLLTEALKKMKPGSIQTDFLDEIGRTLTGGLPQLEPHNNVIDVKVVDAADQAVTGWIEEVESEFASQNILNR
jgi:hypothetical protein